MLGRGQAGEALMVAQDYGGLSHVGKAAKTEGKRGVVVIWIALGAAALALVALVSGLPGRGGNVVLDVDDDTFFNTQHSLGQVGHTLISIYIFTRV